MSSDTDGSGRQSQLSQADCVSTSQKPENYLDKLESEVNSRIDSQILDHAKSEYKSGANLFAFAVTLNGVDITWLRFNPSILNNLIPQHAKTPTTKYSSSDSNGVVKVGPPGIFWPPSSASVSVAGFTHLSSVTNTVAGLRGDYWFLPSICGQKSPGLILRVRGLTAAQCTAVRISAWKKLENWAKDGV